MIDTLDSRLERTFTSLGDRFSRSGLFRRAAVLAGAAVGYGSVTQQALAAPCGETWGACGGQKCCNCYEGCICTGSQYYCGERPPGCYVTTAKWSRCCNHYYRYDWYDCGFLVIGNNTCCGTGGSPGGSLGCASCVSGCGFAYVDCYECTFRRIIAGGCS